MWTTTRVGPRLGVEHDKASSLNKPHQLYDRPVVCRGHSVIKRLETRPFEESEE